MRRPTYSGRAFWVSFSVISCLAIYSLSTNSIAGPSDLLPRDAGAVHDQCRMVHKAPDKCAFIREHCLDDEPAFAAYLELYYCYLADAKPLAFTLLLLWISTLFNTIGIAASDFFCVNLSTIATGLGMSESMAGVTLLAFGNGSPDVFSTFAAMSTNSSSLAIGELIGAASFITAVVAGSMALVRPFKVAKKSFVRDLVFFIVAAAFSMGFLVDGRLHLWECIFMVSFYIFYVLFVLVWHWYLAGRQQRRQRALLARGHFNAPSEDDMVPPPAHYTDDDHGLATSTTTLNGGSSVDLTALEHGSDFAEEVNEQDADDDQVKDRFMSQLNDNMHLSIPLHSHQGHHHHRKSSAAIAPIRPSLVGALEFQAVLNTLQKSRSTQNFPMLPRNNSDFARDPRIHRVQQHHVHSGRPSLERAAGTDYNLHVQQPPTLAVLGNRARAHSTNDALRSSHIESSSRLTDIPPPLLLDIVEEHPGTEYFSPLGHQRSASANLATPIHRVMSTASGESGPHISVCQPQTRYDVASVESPPGTPSSELVVPGSSSGHQTPLSIHSPRLCALSPLRIRDTDPFDEATSDEPPRWWPHAWPTPRQLFDTLFPTLRRWRGKSWASKIISLIGVPSILLLTVTLPVVYPIGEDDSDVLGMTQSTQKLPDDSTALLSDDRTTLSKQRDHDDAGRHGDGDTMQAMPIQALDSPRLGSCQGSLSGSRLWNRWLLIIQLFLAPLMLVLVVYSQSVSFDDTGFWRTMLKPMLITNLLSLIMLIPVLLTSTPYDRPKAYQPILSLVGFVMSIAWISTIANQVVALLKTFALILHMSHAIMGLTFFAVGNSLSDLVADITVARLGFPVMALSACFGGPMLNILLGIGLSGSWILIRGAHRRHAKHPDSELDYKTYQIEVGRSLFVSGITLLVGLVGLLIVVPLNKWMMDRRIAYGLMLLWTVGTCINVVLEIVRGD